MDHTRRSARGSEPAGGFPTARCAVLVPAVPALMAHTLVSQTTSFDGVTLASSNGLVAVVGN